MILGNEPELETELCWKLLPFLSFAKWVTFSLPSQIKLSIITLPKHDSCCFTLSKPSAVFYCWCSSWSGKHRAAAAAAGTGSIVSSDWVKADEVLLLVQPSPPPPAPTPPQHQYQQQQQQRQEEDRKMVAAHTSSHSSESSEWIICLDKR